MEAKHELFWTQADFGYVKDVVDSITMLCKPQHKVRYLDVNMLKYILTTTSTGRFILKLF